jgi:hypothetical protein
MAFGKKDFNGNSKNWGGVIVASEPYTVDLVRVAVAERGNIVAGNLAYSDNNGEAVTSATANNGVLGVYVANTVNLGKEESNVEDAEICSIGTIFVNLKLGETAPKFGQKANVDGDRVTVDNTGTLGRFTGVMGEPMADGSLVAQLRLNVL